MNSIWNRNIELFSKRFPSLAQAVMDAHEDSGRPFTVAPAKNGAPTAFEGTVPLHSKYNPQKEAESLVGTFPEGKAAAAFWSFGLGLAPILFAKKFPKAALIIIEPDARYVAAAFEAADWAPVLEHPDVIFALGATVQEAASLMERFGLSNVQVYAGANQTAHASSYFSQLSQALGKGKQKESVNTNTLEKFSKLWLRNSCRNLRQFVTCGGVKKFMGGGEDIPFVVLAAGPSLSSVLPHLAELKKRSIIVCVDTALHACLAAGVEPDFIVLVDPQEACARHLDFLAAPSSVLITESAAWPSVFRFRCRETVLCSSLFPLGKYFENQLGQKGKLGSGGSVTTTAWDFARSTGTREIFIAGMDLGFPSKQTHIRGSQFEERAHRLSRRTAPAETDGVASLMSAYPKKAEDYDGNPLLTDERMSLFAWWFEENCKRARDAGCCTFTLTPESLAIPGIKKSSVAELLSRPEAEEERAAYFRAADARAEGSVTESRFDEALSQFKAHLAMLSDSAREGIRLCDMAIKDRRRAQDAIKKLDGIDAAILSASAKDAASLVFPTQRQLDAKASDLPSEPMLHQLYYSRLIYTELSESVHQYEKFLP